LIDWDLLWAKVKRKIGERFEPRLLPYWMALLHRANSTSRGSVLGDGPVVTLTTHGQRIHSVHLTIESIARGELRPSRLVLFLDDARLMNDLPTPLKRQMSRGLEVRLTDNYGPHTKYYPYVAGESSFTLPLVTADDDILYPRYWLQTLQRAHARQPELIHCFRAHLPVRNPDHTLAPYSAWVPCETRVPAPHLFGTGVSGVIYPPSFQAQLKAAGTAFQACCPKADDIWLHVMALRHGYAVHQITRLPRHFPTVPDTQAMGLVHTNSAGGGNDAQILATYTPQDLQRMFQTLPVAPDQAHVAQH